MQPPKPHNHSVRIAAVGDLHCTKQCRGMFQPLFARAAAESDVLLLCGDLTDYGQPEEAQLLAAEAKAAQNLPIIAVLGNHDYEAGQAAEVTRILTDAGMRVLDGDAIDLKGIGFVGTKGYFGGYGERMLQAWGEQTTKGIVRDTMEEALKLEKALARLETPQKVVLLHYSPVQATVEGEPREIYPFLGSSRLEEPLHRHPVAAVFHGHAHYGSPEGKAANRIPVYNVSLPLLKRRDPNGAPFRTVSLPIKR